MKKSKAKKKKLLPEASAPSKSISAPGCAKPKARAQPEPGGALGEVLGVFVFQQVQKYEKGVKPRLVHRGLF